MRVEHEGDKTTLVVSRRNLLTLVAKLDGQPSNSACTIGCPMGYGDFWIKAEEDEEHYNHDSRLAIVGDNAAGPMHPDTEAALPAAQRERAILPEEPFFDANCNRQGCNHNGSCGYGAP